VREDVSGSGPPPTPGFEERVRESFARQRIMATLGATLVRVAPGQVEIAIPHREDFAQQHGFLHAGVIATVLDSACGYAAFTLMPSGAAVLSIEFKIHLLAPSAGERLVARGRVVRAGRTITVCAADAYSIRGTKEKHVATMTGTMMTVMGNEMLSG